jgi:ATP-dependent DNA helicase RecG
VATSMKIWSSSCYFSNTANPISYEGIRRVEKRPYPRDSLREAVVNSIVHSDYGANNPIQIKVFPDRLTIFNEGSPPSDWTVETLLTSHESRPGNPSIATVFHRAGMIENFGRGIEKIMNEYKGQSVKPPMFRFTQSEFNVTFFNENYDDSVQKIEKPPLSETQMILLKSVINADCSIQELMSIVSADNREGFRKYVLKPLLELNLIEMTIGDKPNSKYQKYRITKDGIKHIDQLS